MPRKKTKSFKRDIAPDIKYNNVLVSQIINKIMKDGKKSLAQKLIYGALDEVAAKSKLDPIEVFETAIKNVAPALQVKARRIGGANYQVPVEVRGERKAHYAMSWILGAALNTKGKSFDKALADEILNAYNNQGDAIKKKEDTHKMAEANKAFAHFARF